MDNSNFDWDDANILHLAEHQVSPEEAEEVVLGDPMELQFAKSAQGEDRWEYLGETVPGRFLLVVISMRGEKVRVVTAYEPIRRLKLIYLRFRQETNERF
ncbi:BrnT family toxin [Acidobacteria bacterium AB60]|nr:BrnT family toxin [Acidobacteria bacterium AB60]